MIRTTTMTGLLLAGFLALCDGRPASGLDKKPDDAPKETKVAFNPAAVDWDTVRYAEARDRIRRERFSLIAEEEWVAHLERGARMKNVAPADLERAKAVLKGERERVDLLWKEWETTGRNVASSSPSVWREYAAPNPERGGFGGAGGAGGGRVPAVRGGPGGAAGGRGPGAGGFPGGGAAQVEAPAQPNPPAKGFEPSPDVVGWLNVGFSVGFSRVESARDALKRHDRWVERLQAGVASKDIEPAELEREKKDRARLAGRVSSLEKELAEVAARMKLCGLAVPVYEEFQIHSMIHSTMIGQQRVSYTSLDQTRYEPTAAVATAAKASARSERAQTNLARLMERQKTGTATGLEVDRAMFEVTSAALLDELDGLIARHAKSLAALEKAEGSEEQVKSLKATIARLEARRVAIDKASRE